ncbi:acetylxylan esterase [uncultured Paludibaculum sp.]|uniref:alpha/beta hydrolase family protein n=1 Tax=uncultured Paludibaculum sp. TaxID=1765020 RepID=UPI002AAC0826|nr:acetylxylan esterase [uncultured Paludibaculum sp.]
MRPLLFLFISTLIVCAADRRNLECPNTDTHATFQAPASLQQWEQRRHQLRLQILSSAGLLPLPAKTPLAPLIYDKLDRDGYTIEKVALETRPGYWLGGNLYRPKGKTGKFPAILHPHGHWAYGRLENQPLCSTPTLAINLARHGFLVFAYDMVGYNDTSQTPHDFSTPKYQLWGFTPLGLQLWNSIRALDFVASLPDVDPVKLGVTGASGGGTQDFLLTAVDDRVAVSAPVNMVSGIMQGGCVCENAPGLRVGTNNIEIAAMTAPRPMLMVAATGDWTRNVPKEEYPSVQKLYALYGKADQVENVQFDAPHNYNKDSRQAVYDFLRRKLRPEEPAFQESGATVEGLQDMLVFFGRPRPDRGRSFSQLFDEWKAEAMGMEKTATAAELKQRLQLVFDGSDPAPELGSAIPYRFVEGKGPAVLYVHPDGIAGAEASSGFQKLKAEGRAVLLIDAFQTGTAKAARDRSHRHFLTFNRSDAAARVQDVQAAVNWLAAKRPGEAVELAAEGDARWWALFAAATVPQRVRFASSPTEFQVSDDVLAERFFVPGLRRAGGVEAAEKILKASAR